MSPASGSQMLRGERVVISTWRLQGFGVLKARKTAGAHPEEPLGRVLCGCVCFLMWVFLSLRLSGIIGERLPVRYYLTCGMLASGAFTALFGFGYFYSIHSFGFYVVTQVGPGALAHRGWGGPDVLPSQVPTSARRGVGR